MSKQARELAELMGWKHGVVGVVVCWQTPEGLLFKGLEHDGPCFDTDHNAMHEVHKVLYERGLFNEAWKVYWGMSGKDNANELLSIPDCIHYWLNDLPGQVQAAIQVFKEAK